MKSTIHLSCPRIFVSLIFASFFTMLPLTHAAPFDPGTVPKRDINTNEEAVVLLLLDEGRGNKAMDSSGLGNHGALEGGADWAKGKFGMAVELGPGNNGFQRIEIPPDNSHALHTMTVMGWFKINGQLGNDSFLIDKSCWGCASQLPRNFSLWEHHLKTALQLGWRDNGDLGGGGDRWAETPPSAHIHDGTWRHLGGTYDGTDIKVYIDGEEEGVRRFPSEPGDPNAPAYLNAPIVIGALGPAGQGHGFPKGTLVDEVAIFSYALDAEEIKSAMEDGLSNTFVRAVNPQDKLATTWGRLKAQPQ